MRLKVSNEQSSPRISIQDPSLLFLQVVPAACRFNCSFEAFYDLCIILPLLPVSYFIRNLLYTYPTYTCTCSRKILCFRKIISNYAENIFMFTTAQSTPQRQLLVFACSCVQTTWLRDPWRYPLLPTAELPQVQLPSYSTTFQVKTTRCSQYLQF